MAAVAEDNRELFRTHPWTAIVSTLRPPLGPGQMAKYEHELAAFDDCGLDDAVADECLTHLLTFVRANARDAPDALDAHHTRRDSAMNDEQWWASACPILARVLNPDHYPPGHPHRDRRSRRAGQRPQPHPHLPLRARRLLDGLAPIIEPPPATH